MSITDVLTLTTPPDFTVDNTQLFINETGVVNKPFQNAAGNDEFVQNDPILIKSIGIRFPACFTSYETITKLNFSWWDGATEFPITEIDGATGSINIPFPDVEIPLDIYALYPAAAVANCQIVLSNWVIQVSMLNVPDAVNAETLNLDPVLKILHTIPMTT